MKRLILSFIILLIVNFSFGQHVEKLDYCNCVDKIDQLTPNLNGNFERKCNGVTTLKGQFVNGKMNGEWLTYSKSGKLIRKLKYNNGLLDGDFELFFINGSKKLTAHFENGKKVGKWTYYGFNGEMFIEGSYNDNKPVGVWTIKDIEGKNVAVQYDYDAKKYLVNKPVVYYKDGDVIFNENTEEWYILHKPESEHIITIPLGGMDLAVFIFIKSVEVPETIFNTYLHNKYKMSLSISSESEMKFTQTKVEGDCPKDQENLLFAINTNEPSKIKKVTLSKIETELIDMKINEAMHILPPWISSQDMNGDVYVHYIINKNLHRL
jgi:hypothetical protein